MGRSRWLALLALVVVAAAVVLYFTLNQIIRFGLERGGTEALGVQTDVRSVDVRPLRGRFGVSGASVANPPGFQASHFLEIGDADFRVEVGTLRSDELVMSLVSLSGIEISLERTSKGTNYDVILANLARFGGQGAAAEEPEGGQTLRIRELVIQDLSAHANIQVAGRATGVDVRVPDVRLKNLSSSSSAGGIGAQLAGILTTAVLRTVAKEGRGLPAGLASSIRGGLGTVSGYVTGELDRLGTEKLGLGQKAEETVEKAEEALKKGFGRFLDREDR